MFEIKSLLSSISDANKQRQSLGSELSGITQSISELDEKISALMRMPLNLQDYFSFLKGAIQEKGREHMHLVGWQLLRSAGGHTPANTLPLCDVEIGVSLPEHFFGKDPEAALCSYFGEHVYNIFLERAETEFGEKWGNKDLPPLSERRKLIADYEAKKMELLPKRDELQSTLAEIEAALRG